MRLSRRPRDGARGSGATSGGRARGGAVTEERTARSTEQDRLAEEPRDPVNQLGSIEPGPVAGLHELELGLAAERLGIAGPELLGDVRIAGGPEHQGGAAQLPEALARAREGVLRGGAVELEDRALGSVVVVLPGAVDEPVGQGAGLDCRVGGEAAEGPLGAEPHEQLAEQRPAPDA